MKTPLRPSGITPGALKRRIYNARHGINGKVASTNMRPAPAPGYVGGAAKKSAFKPPARAVKGYGGVLNARGIETFRSEKYGSPVEPGVLGSGRRAPARGFGQHRAVGSRENPVGVRQVFQRPPFGEKYW